jgi:thiol-disulfide isomerase/thioredoxin
MRLFVLFFLAACTTSPAALPNPDQPAMALDRVATPAVQAEEEGCDEAGGAAQPGCACGCGENTETAEAPAPEGQRGGVVDMDEVVWLQGRAPSAEGVQVVAFWEVWCPHCRTHLPKLDALAADLKLDGISVVGLTRQTRGTTEEAVVAFVEDQDITIPIGREDGSIAREVGVNGVPAVAVTVDGEVAWMGHPSRLDLAWLRRLATDG